MKQIISILSIAILLSGFASAIFAQEDCSSAVDIASLPYSETGLTTVGTLNDYSDLDACGSASMLNEDYVFSFTPGEDMQINVELLNTEIVTGSVIPFTNIGLFIIEGCPDIPGTCVASVDDVQANPSLTDVDLTSGTTYYIIISSANTLLTDATNVNFDINITKNAMVDLTVTSLVLPNSACGLTDGTIGCYIENLGLVDAVNFTISYSINGTPAVEEIYSETIVPTESALYEFTAPASFPTVGEYEIDVVVSIPLDENSANDEMSGVVVHLPVISSLPYTEDFEADNGFWFAGGTDFSWEYGDPDDLITELIINSASSGDYCWVTNLAGAATANEASFIESPCYDLTSLSYPTLEVSIWANFGIIGNSASIESSIDGGTTWLAVATIDASTDGWETISAEMYTLAGESNVKFRINFTGGFLNGDGLAIDDFTIQEAVLNDLGVTNITMPISGCGLTDAETVTIEITNYGAEAQTDIPVDYSIDGGLTWLVSTETATITIASGESATFTFTTTCDLSAYGNYEIVAKTVNIGDEDATNDENSTMVASQATIDAAGYLQSFEVDAAGWMAFGDNSTMELAMPANTLINMAGDGDYAWVTNADGFNDAAEISYLESPCFDFTGFVNPKFKAMIQYETTQLTTNFYLEYSIDGMTWDTVQAGGAATNWYGGGLVGFGTWSGTSEGWITATTDIPEIAGQASVKFRFAFNNGAFSMADTEGVAIDMINIYDCTDMPTASFSYEIDGTAVNFTNESENGTSYDWNFGDNEFLPSTSTEEDPSFSYLTDGSYIVTLTVTNDCSSVEYSSTIDIATDIVTSENFSGVYPNPASEMLYVKVANNESFTYQIININGQVIVSSESNSEYQEIDIRNLSAGTYYIKISTETETLSNQFIKK